MKKLKAPIYAFKRTPEEITKAYEDNNITKYKWSPLGVSLTSAWVPFGYLQDVDSDILLPIDYELDVLEHAKTLLELRNKNKLYQRFYSLRKLATWVTEMTGRPISHQGLKTRIRDDYARQQKEEQEIFERVQQEVRSKAKYIGFEAS